MTDFQDVRAEPDPVFAERLERLLLADMGWADGGSDSGSGSGSGSDGGGSMGRRGGRSPGSRRPLVGAISALLVAALVVLGLVLSHRAPSSVVGTVPVLPASGPVAPGTYQTAEFDPRLSITTVGPWDVAYGDAKGILLTRGTDLGTGFFVVRDPRGQGTVEAALASVCVGGRIEFGPPQDATLLGVPATMLEGTATEICIIWTEYAALIGDRVRVIAADVDGTPVMVVATGPEAQWPSLSREFDAMVASMTLASGG